MSVNVKHERHGMSRTKEHVIWRGIKNRCYNPKQKDYARYGGRGIRMSDEWRISFTAFFADMGECPDGYSIERIDNNRGYEAGNCKWIPRQRQSQNQCKNVRVTIGGETKCLAEWARERGVPLGVAYWRFRQQWPIEKVFTRSKRIRSAVTGRFTQLGDMGP